MCLHEFFPVHQLRCLRLKADYTPFPRYAIPDHAILHHLQVQARSSRSCDYVFAITAITHKVFATTGKGIAVLLLPKLFLCRRP